MKVSELRDVDRAAYTRAANGWRKVSHQAKADMDVVNNTMLPQLTSSKGHTKHEAHRALSTLGRNHQYVQIQAGLIHTALRSLAEDLEAPQRALRQALAEASELGITVQESGSVSYPDVPSPDGGVLPGGTASGGTAAEVPTLSATDEALRYTRDSAPERNPKAAVAERLSATIAKALRDAERVDSQHAATLARLTTERGLTVDNKTWADSASDRRAVEKVAGDNYEKSDIPENKSPAGNARWWDGLSAAERDAYVTMYPASVGALDGIPAEVRDTANRTVLREEQANVAAALTRHRAGEPTKYRDMELGVTVSREWSAWDKKRKLLEEHQEGMRSIDRRFDQTGVRGLPEAYLLGFDRDKLGHAVVANGNPDTADHTAVFVPGTGSRLGSAESDIKRMSELWHTSDSYAGGDTVSTITWIGYDAPQSAIPIVDGDLVPEASDPSYAKAGSPKLERFMAGLDAAHESPRDNHRTIISHSYGTSLVGDAAAAAKNMRVDDIAAIASPGMFTSSADGLVTGRDNTWSMAADFPKDLVPQAGKSTVLTGSPTGPAKTVLDSLGIPAPFFSDANVPSDEVFGARRMKTDAEDHSGYWENNSMSKENQALLIVGKYDDISMVEEGK